MKWAAWVGLFPVLIASAAEAKLTIGSPFADHAVLQRDQPVAVWGWAEVGDTITVGFAGQSKTATADAKGKWTVRLDPLPASAEPRTMTITGWEIISINDIVVGEVWLASGQSNMAFPLSAAHNAETELPQANDPLLRFFTVTHDTAAEPREQLTGKWEAATPTAAKGFSAVAYFFAKDLRARLGCPVGVLHSSWGGTSGQTWVSVAGLHRDPALAMHVSRSAEALAKHREVLAHPEWIETYQAELKKWQKEVQPSFDEAMKKYNASGASGPKPMPSRPEPANPDPTGMPSPSARPSVPGVLFNAMINPLVPYSLRGVIWYQGEANGASGMEYRSLLPALIADWRTQWGSEFPFLFVQLPGWNHDTKPDELADWPWLREAQFRTLSVPKTGMAIAIDLGDPKDVHPKGKLDVGRRLALAARKVAYGESIVASGPLFRSVEVKESAIRIRFDSVGGGLKIGQSPWLAPDVEQYPKDKLIGFVIAGEDRQWRPATASIEGEQVVVSSPDVPKPVAVRYGWANSPRCNLYNAENLPASPFRSDDWPLPAPPKK